MNKNITLSAEENLIQQAREKASQENSTLNEQFRLWLQRYVSTGTRAVDYMNLMERLSYARTVKSFTRDELNER